MIAISRRVLADGSLQPWRDRVHELAGEPGAPAYDRRLAEGQEPDEEAGRAVREVGGERAAIAASLSLQDRAQPSIEWGQEKE